MTRTQSRLGRRMQAVRLVAQNPPSRVVEGMEFGIIMGSNPRAA
jgi:hypothetical protein